MELEVLLMGRTKYTREFKLEAIKLIEERGVTVARASRDLGVHQNTLRAWVSEFAADPEHSFPGHGQMKPEALELERLRREVLRLKAERDILKKAAAYFAKESL
jgi:transposase